MPILEFSRWSHSSPDRSIQCGGCNHDTDEQRDSRVSRRAEPVQAAMERSCASTGLDTGNDKVFR
jgi:hypothetical protein